MIEAAASFDTKAPVSLLKSLNSGLLGVVDSYSAVSYADLRSYKRARGLAIGIDQEGCTGNRVDLDRTGQLCAVADRTERKVFLYNVQTKRRLHIFDRHKGASESVAFDAKSRYLATGGEDGKVFVRSIRSGKLVMTLPPHSDYVSAIAFSEGFESIASGSLDRSIHLLHIGTQRAASRLIGHRNSVIDLLFLGSSRLLSVGKEGELIIWDVHKAVVLKRLEKMNDEITSICTTSDHKALFVGTRLGYIALYDLRESVLMSRTYCKASSTVCSLAYSQKHQTLAAGTLDGDVFLYKLFGDEQLLGHYLETKEYEKFYLALEANPMLHLSDLYLQAEAAWKSAMSEAERLLSEGRRAGAKRLLGPFEAIKGKRTEIEALFRDQEEYALFKRHIDEQRYSLAYAMLVHHPDFRTSAAYFEAEMTWQRVFKRAQELFEMRRDEEEASAALAPFRGISEKSVKIRALFDENRRLLFFEDLKAKQEYRKLFELVKNHPSLKEHRSYKALLEYADKLYIQIQRSYAQREMSRVRRLCEILLDFPDYKEDVKGVLDAIDK